MLAFVLSFGYLVYFYWAAGARLPVGAAIAGLIIVNYVVWARLRAETGLGFIPFPLIVNSMIVVPFGSAIFRPREIVALFSTRWAYFPGFGESFEVCTGNSLESLKIADSARISSRRLLYAMVGGFVLALAVGVFVVISGMYEYGFLNTRAASSGWLSGQLRSTGSQTFELITNPSKLDVKGTIAMGGGGGGNARAGGAAAEVLVVAVPPDRVSRRLLLGDALVLAAVLPGVAAQEPGYPVWGAAALPADGSTGDWLDRGRFREPGDVGVRAVGAARVGSGCVSRMRWLESLEGSGQDGFTS